MSSHKGQQLHEEDLQGDAAVNGDGGRVGADVAALKDVPRPSHLPVDFLASCRKRMVCWHHWYMDELYKLILVKVDVLATFHVVIK